MSKPNQDRLLAMQEGRTRYIGRPCKNCSGVIRQVTSGGCVICSNKNSLRYFGTEKGKQKRSETVKRYRKTPKGKLFERKRKIKCLYGITLEQYNEMESKQNKKCLLCEKEQNVLCIDHNHKTKKIRGLLCKLCNKGLGVFKDDIKILERAINYLKDSNTNG